MAVYENKETYERSQRSEEGESKMEVNELMRNFGETKAQALFVTVSSRITSCFYDGICVTQPYITRDKKLDRIIESIQGGQRFHVISSSPASGKTSLLRLIIGQTSKIKFIDVTFLYKGKAEDTLKYHTGIDLVNKSAAFHFQSKL